MVTARTHSPALSYDPEFAKLWASLGGEYSPRLMRSEDDIDSKIPSHGHSPATLRLEVLSQEADDPDPQTPEVYSEGRELVKQRPSSTSPLYSLIDVKDFTASIVYATKVLVTSGRELETTNPAPSDVSPAPTKPFRRRKNYIWYQFQHSLTLLEQGNVHDAFKDLQRGCSMAEQYLLRPNKQILMSLLIVMGNRRWGRHQQAWLSVLRFLASMSLNALGPKHPLTHILSHINSWELMRGVAQPAMRVVLDTYSKQLGAGHPEVMLLKQGLSVELMRDGDYDNSEALIQEAVDLTSNTWGESSLARRHCLRRLGNLYVEQHRWNEAETIFENVIALDSMANSHHGPTDETSVFTYQNLSVISCRKGEMLKSEYWAEQEMDLALSVYGKEDEYYMDCLKRRTARLNGEPSEKWFSWLEVS